jgi:response regulator RpfG family c-di-GMP phosphodiesterase
VIFIFNRFKKSERREDTIVPFLHGNNKTQPIKEYLDNTRILIVEDNKINMLLAKKLVKKIMPLYHFLKRQMVKKAIKLYKKQKLDVILMDIKCLKKMVLKLLLQLES